MHYILFHPRTTLVDPEPREQVGTILVGTTFLQARHLKDVRFGSHGQCINHGTIVHGIDEKCVEIALRVRVKAESEFPYSQ